MGQRIMTQRTLIWVVLGAVIFFSGLALLYNVRWYVPYLNDGIHYIVPAGNIPGLWFVVQIVDNLIYLFVGYLLARLFSKFQRTGYFDQKSLKSFDGIILSCVLLAIIGAIQTVLNNFGEVHLDEWNSLAAVANLLFRSFTHLIVFREPQTMFLLLAVILWVVKQFVNRALFVKIDNEAII
jgi:hypothetical protein